jgi:hypothetical protein
MTEIMEPQRPQARAVAYLAVAPTERVAVQLPSRQRPRENQILVTRIAWPPTQQGFGELRR